MSTCYAAVGMPLAFTQEDFLVINLGYAIARYFCYLDKFDTSVCRICSAGSFLEMVIVLLIKDIIWPMLSTHAQADLLFSVTINTRLLCGSSED